MNKFFYFFYAFFAFDCYRWYMVCCTISRKGCAKWTRQWYCRIYNYTFPVEYSSSLTWGAVMLWVICSYEYFMKKLRRGRYCKMNYNVISVSQIVWNIGRKCKKALNYNDIICIVRKSALSLQRVFHGIRFKVM